MKLDERTARETLVYEALRFANWAAGEGICPVEGENAKAPEDFLMEFSNATNDEEWDTLADRLSALPSSPVSELEREVKRLREAMFVADDTIMTLHGCFPLGRVSKKDVRLNEAAKFIRSFTSDDYYERKRIVDAFFAALSISPQGGEHD